MGWGDSWEKVPKPFGQVMKEFNERSTLIITGIDQGSPDGDKTIVSLSDGHTVKVIGESVTLQIPIKAGWQTRTINAIQVGDLAVCFDNEDEEIGLVTHVPTLTRFDNAIPDGEWTQEQLIRWCWKVQQDNDNLWADLRAYNNSTYKSITKELLDPVQNHCLSVCVE